MKKDEYIKIIIKYKKIYLPQIKKIKQKFIWTMNNYDKNSLINIMVEHRNLIKNLILDVINEFEEFRKIKCCIMLNGSLARGTNTFYSDIDINYFYSNDYFEKMINVEEEVNYILQTIMGYRGKDRIHSMVVYLPLIRKNDYESIKDNKYPIHFDDGVIYNKCRENAEELMYQTFNSTRSIYDLCDYLNLNDNTSSIKEWANCFELVYDNGLYEEFIKNRKVCKDTDNLSNLIHNIMESINRDNYFIDDKTAQIKIKELKNTYKMQVLYNVYELLALYFRLNKKFKNINIFNYEKENIGIKKEFYETFYKYMNLIQKLQFILDDNDMDFSFHSTKVVTNKFLNQEYKKTFNYNNIIFDLNNEKKKLYKICKDILIEEMIKYEK